MKFVKMHGTGNDYVYVDLFAGKIADPAKAAVAVSHRRFGIGGDGLILIKPRPDADGEMEMYNADGSMSEMCGNGLRCVAKYVHDHYARGKDELKLMTGAGWRFARIVKRDAAGAAEEVRLDMGAPIWDGPKIPTTLAGEVLEKKLEVAGKSFTFSSVSMGNPHCVIYVDDVARFPVEQIGPLIETHPLFPRKVNVEFVQVISKEEAIQRTWERGSGETWACGTGASAVAAVGYRLGKTGSRLTLRLTGGNLLLEYDGKGSVFMTGNAVEVFQGEFPGL
ncbi:MAG: diaminopimelate epimerase [Fibrobacteres bacterium]|jgi:diaminopimelate epimerase|nr:diaminopimelate epimerase [Fibrobacterota bacterium]